VAIKGSISSEGISFIVLSHASCLWLSHESQEDACKGRDAFVQKQSCLRKATSSYGNCDTTCERMSGCCETINRYA
jgi:hypothetical protein